MGEQLRAATTPLCEWHLSPARDKPPRARRRHLHQETRREARANPRNCAQHPSGRASGTSQSGETCLLVLAGGTSIRRHAKERGRIRAIAHDTHSLGKCEWHLPVRGDKPPSRNCARRPPECNNDCKDSEGAGRGPRTRLPYHGPLGGPTSALCASQRGSLPSHPDHGRWRIRRRALAVRGSKGGEFL